MSQLPALPLARIVARASALPPSGEAQRRRARSGLGPGTRIVLLDVSGSMAELAGKRARIVHLREALQQVARPEHVLLAFASAVRQIARPDELPEPDGGTALDLALQVAATYAPVSTLVVSDGQPTAPDAALAAADALPGRIDVIYCGDERDTAAIDFMRRLARLGCGRVVVHSWGHAPSAAALAAPMRQLLLARA